MRAVTTLGATMALLSLTPGVHVNLNPFKPKWGLVTIGNTSYDLLDGIPSTVKFVARMSRAFYRRSEGAEPEKVGGEPQTEWTLARDFLRWRASPSAGVVWDLAAGSTKEGEFVTPKTAARDLLLQFTVEGMYDAWVDAGGSRLGDVGYGKGLKTGFKGAARGLPSMIGIPSSTRPDNRPQYTRSRREKAPEPIDLSDIAEPR